MTFSRTVGAASLLGLLALLGSGPALAQSEPDDVPLIMLKPQGAGALSAPPPAKALRRHKEAFRQGAGTGPAADEDRSVDRSRRKASRT